MGYDQKFFKSSANKKAMYMWMITAIILSVAYTIELIKGEQHFWQSRELIPPGTKKQLR